MIIEVPDTCECTDEFVCSKCTWVTACAIVELNHSYEKIAKEVED